MSPSPTAPVGRPTEPGPSQESLSMDHDRTEQRIPEHKFYRFRAQALFYFPNLPLHIRKLNISNRKLAEGTEPYSDRQITEGTIRRIANGNPVGFQSVKAVYKAIAAKYKEKKLPFDDSNETADVEILKAIYRLVDLKAHLEKAQLETTALAKAAQVPQQIIDNAVLGQRVPWLIGIRILEVLNTALEKAGLESVPPSSMLDAEPVPGNEPDVGLRQASRKSALGVLTDPEMLQLS